MSMPCARYQSSPMPSSPAADRRPRVYTGSCSRRSRVSGIAPAWRAARRRSWRSCAARYSTTPRWTVHSSPGTLPMMPDRGGAAAGLRGPGPRFLIGAPLPPGGCAMAETVRTTSAIDEVLRGAVDRDVVPGVVAMAAREDGEIYEGAAGVREAGKDDQITAEPMMRIASMTKMVATVAAPQLVEQGRIDLDAPVETYRPEFAELQVLEGFDGDTPRLRAPASKATVRQLITHSSGLGYWFFNEDIVRWEAATGTPNVMSGDEVIFKAPLVSDPGTRYEYGINTDWLGLVVEAASGAPLDAYI